MEKGGGGAVNYFLFLSAAGAAAGVVVAAMRYHSFRRSMVRNRTLAPRLRLTASGRVDEVESFSEYVGRQLGFGSPKECPALAKLATDYIKGAEDNIYSFFESDPNPEAMCRNLVNELDRCVLGYFAFHWSHATLMVSKVLSSNSDSKKKLRNIVMEATRKIRFDRITKDLKVTRLFSTLVEEMKAIGKGSSEESQHCTEVMVPADRSERSPVLLLMGGGMGAGKSTVLKDILKESFWTSTDPVVVEADAFKETDVIYRALSSRGHHNDMLQTAELVHQSSTDAASSLLVTALNEGRDVIMDGTLSWAPFVEQTIAMARSVHQRRYRMGVGYKVADDGEVTENYWEPVEEDDDDSQQKDVPRCPKKPYRIELVGVVCDAYLAVVMGLRRAIIVGRAVRVKSQLRSHKMFARAFAGYSQLVDNARLYSNSMGSPPKLIAWKDSDSSLLVDSEEIGVLTKVSSLNEEADSIYELYPEAAEATRGPVSVWDSVVLSRHRELSQKELRAAVKAIEAPAT